MDVWRAGHVWEVMTDATTKISQIIRTLNTTLRYLDFIVEMGKW